MLVFLVHLCAGSLLPWISLPAVYLAITGLFIVASLLVTLKNIDRETESISLRQNGDLFMRAGRETEWHFMDISSAFISGWLIVLIRLHGPAHTRNSVDVTF